MTPQVSIVIVNWNTSDLLADCLRSIYEKERQLGIEVIVIDNGSTDDSVEMCERDFPRAHLIRNSENLGFGQANNLGLRASAAPYCLLLNSDTLVERGSLERLWSVIDSEPHVAIAGCRLLNIDGSVQESCMRFPRPSLLLFQELMLYRLLPSRFRLFVEPPRLNYPTPCDWVYGAAMMVRKEAMEDLGGFDPEIWMYGEEMDLCYRANRRGWQVVFDPVARVTHLGEGSWRGNALRPMLLRQRGLLHFYRRHMPRVTIPIAWLALAFGAAIRCIAWAIWSLARLHRSSLRTKGLSQAAINGRLFLNMVLPFWAGAHGQ